LIFGTSSVVFLVYGIFKIFMTVKVSPENWISWLYTFIRDQFCYEFMNR
jgi:hypothetical protein